MSQFFKHAGSFVKSDVEYIEIVDKLYIESISVIFATMSITVVKSKAHNDPRVYKIIYFNTNGRNVIYTTIRVGFDIFTRNHYIEIPNCIKINVKRFKLGVLNQILINTGDKSVETVFDIKAASVKLVLTKERFLNV